MRKPKEIVIDDRTLEQILKEDIYADLEEVDLEDADLQGADLRDANLTGAFLEGANLKDADLRNADLQGADLRDANLTGAFLEGANLKDADLRNANLRYAHLMYANLRNANLRYANLMYANLIYANLIYANLIEAYLRGAYLKGTKLDYTNLDGADLGRNYLMGAEGNLMEYRKGKILTEDIIGYKKCQNEIIVTLLIPKRAIVFSINGKKCRTNRAKVIAIDGADRAYSRHNGMSYYVGDEFNIYNFNCQYNIECGEGIHFFMTKEEAEKY